jgi:NADP-dependent 3-hydroxy acid dehydrogenase YdfG
VADVTKRDQVEQAVAGTIAQFGRLDIVINNAGVEYLDPVSQINEAELRHMLEVNCFGALYVTQSALPRMTGQGSGLIVMVSSPMVHLNFPFMGGYAASKAASMVLAETLRREVSGQGVRVMTCHPGHTDTAIASHMPRDRFPSWYGKRTNTLRPGDVAERLVLGIIRQEKQVVIGGPVRFLLTMKQYMPSLANRIIGKITAAT